MTDYIKRAMAVQMPVTIDVYIDKESMWDGEQTEFLNQLGKNIRG